MTYFCEHSLSKEDIGRYSRQLVVDEVGVRGQEKLRDSSILIIGAGGLGCPVAIYLASSGIGTIGILDHDIVSLDNLHRQILHEESRIGTSKSKSIKDAVHRLNSKLLNSSTNVIPYSVQITRENAMEIVKNYDIVADCSDNVATRYLINDACVLLNKVLVSGSALRWEGQLSVYNNGNDCPCYRCIFPEPPKPENITNCSEGGVLGPIVGIIGSMQALEVIKIVVGIGSSFSGSMFIFDGILGRIRNIKLRSKTADCVVCGPNSSINEILPDYALFCGVGACDKAERLPYSVRCTVHEYALERKTDRKPTLLDVRSKNEFQICHLPEAINIPMPELYRLDWNEITTKLVKSESGIISELTLICHHGKDSQLMVLLLRDKIQEAQVNVDYPFIYIRDILGGLDAWAIHIDPTFPRY